MKRISLWIASFGFLLALAAPVSTAVAATDVSIGLRIGDRYRGPDIYFRSAPRMYVVPGTRVYYVRDYDYDIYRYGRFWYMNHDGMWYRSRGYRGPWIFVGYRSVPREISYVPQRYRRHWRSFQDRPRNVDRDWRDRRNRDNRDNRDWRDRDNRDRDNRDRDYDRDRTWRDRGY